MLLLDPLPILLVIFIAVMISLISALLPKKIGITLEVILAVSVLLYLFITFSFGQAMMLMAFAASAYGTFGMLIDRRKMEKRTELKQRLQRVNSIEIDHEKDTRRIALDLVLTLFLSIGSVLFFLYAPETYAVVKMVIVFMLLSVLAQIIERVANFYSTRLFWLPEEEHLVILSRFQSRDFPIHDLKEVNIESSPDLLKLHPLFTFMSSNQDYTGSFKQVLKLSFPGENIYLTPYNVETWKDLFGKYAKGMDDKQAKNVLPIWHPTTLKRLFWKGYFAITVKGVSAYTGLLLILIWLNAPTWAIIGFVILWWIFNMSVSDRVLVAATDAVPLTKGEVYERAKHIFKKAGVPDTRLFIVDSPVYNGMATGMNIGRATVMLTTATTKLPISAIEAVLAHEAIHVKKRDVLINQLARMAFFGLLAGTVFLFFDGLRLLVDDHFILLTFLIYVLMIAFPIYLSFVAQWTEVRADYFGGTLLPGGRKQMANGLSELANAQDRELDKSFEYSLSDNRSSPKRSSSIERDSWFWRFIEFQFQAHPPMYWRIQSLINHSKWSKLRNRWLIDRVREALPDILRKNETSRGQMK